MNNNNYLSEILNPEIKFNPDLMENAKINDAIDGTDRILKQSVNFKAINKAIFDILSWHF